PKEDEEDVQTVNRDDSSWQKHWFTSAEEEKLGGEGEDLEELEDDEEDDHWQTDMEFDKEVCWWVKDAEEWEEYKAFAKRMDWDEVSTCCTAYVCVLLVYRSRE
ncbi:unnamed protein product, partial [Choristocarpus tenellus]